MKGPTTLASYGFKIFLFKDACSSIYHYLIRFKLELRLALTGICFLNNSCFENTRFMVELPDRDDEFLLR